MPLETVTWLELTAPGELVASQQPDVLELREVDTDALALVVQIYERVWEPLGGGGRSDWTEEHWREELSRPEIRAWIAELEGDAVGLLELESSTDGDAGIVVFGLVPELVGKGFGGPFLTSATRLAWAQAPSARRVVVCTSSHDHPTAQPNYERRGFRVFRTEVR